MVWSTWYTTYLSVCKRAWSQKHFLIWWLWCFFDGIKKKMYLPTLSTFFKSLFHLIDEECSQKEKLFFCRRTQQSTLVKKLDLVNQKIGKKGAKESKIKVEKTYHGAYLRLNGKYFVLFWYFDYFLVNQRQKIFMFLEVDCNAYSICA